MNATALPPGATAAALDRLWPQPRPHQGDPVGWCTHHGIELWSAQIRMLESAERSRRSARPSGHGTGKSHTAAIWIAYGVTTLPGVLYLHTCPVASQLENVLRPLRELHRRLELPGHITRSQVPEWIIDGRVVYRGRSAKDGGTSNLAGSHARNMRVVADEADGMAAEQWEQLMGALTGESNRLMTIGNPRDPASAWRSYCESGAWDVEHLNVLQSPAFTGEPVSPELLEVLPSTTWVEEARKTWGEGSSLWMARVEGQWPDAADNAILPISLLDHARRPTRPDQPRTHGDDRPLYSIDVAGDGADRTVIGLLLERSYRTLEQHLDWDTADAATRLAGLLDQHPGARVVIDCDGIGVGVRDQLRANGYRSRIIEFKASRKSAKPDQFPNLRSEAWWNLRETLSETVVLDPDDPAAQDLDGELAAVQYQEDRKGLIAVEKKADTIKRLGRSPDLGDTLMMAAWAYTQRPSRSAARPRPALPKRHALLDRPM